MQSKFKTLGFFIKSPTCPFAALPGTLAAAGQRGVPGLATANRGEMLLAVTAMLGLPRRCCFIMSCNPVISTIHQLQMAVEPSQGEEGFISWQKHGAAILRLTHESRRSGTEGKALGNICVSRRRAAGILINASFLQTSSLATADLSKPRIRGRVYKAVAPGRS